MKKLYIFDLDGTLLDTIHTIADSANSALEHFGLPTLETEKYKYFVNKGSKNLILLALNAIGCNTEENFNKVFPLFTELYKKNTFLKPTHFPDMPKTLAKLKEKGIRLAVVSNKPHSLLEPLVPLYFGDDLFDYVLGGRENIPLKPDPYAVNEVLSLCGISPKDAVFVGDTGIDMQAGKAAGVFSIGVLWGFREEKELLENGADVLISNTTELLNYIEA